MTIRHTRKSYRTGSKSLGQIKRQRERIQRRKLLLEDLEQRRVMAVGPNLAGIQPDHGSLLAPNAVLSVSPRELNFKFTNDQGFGLDTTTLDGGIQLLRAGLDGEFANNSVTIKPGYIGLGDTNQEVVMRFAEPLPDDTYRVLIVGNNSLGATPVILRDAGGNPYNGGNSDMVEFRLNLGAQVRAVVPQPIDRAVNGLLTQRRSDIDVYFNDDKLNPASAQNVNFYQLILTSNTVSPVDDAAAGNVIKPTGVVYNAAQNKATLTFSAPIETLNPNNYALRLRIGTDETIDGTVYTPIQANDPLSTFNGALDTGSLSGNKVYDDAITVKPYDLQWPGGNDDPGHRDTPVDDEKHLNDGQGDSSGITIRHYNFKRGLGTISDGRGGFQQAFNTITENQKQRAREVFELYSRYSGIQFVESQDQGLTVATADLRVANPEIPSAPGGVAGLGGGNLAVMDVAENWNDSYGGSWFQTAMHEIGHAIGLGHTYDLPPTTVQGNDGGLGSSEPVFPGDNDIVHLQRIYRPEGQDIDMYKFDIAAGQSGTFSAETFSERLQNGTTLDTYLRLYKQGPNGPELVAINDDYFSKDSLIQLQLDGGENGTTYFLGVSAKGNEQYDPAATDSGMGGTSEGAYRLSMNFRPTVSAQRTIVDTTGVPLDGDNDGIAGGVFNFWFKTAAPIAPGQTTHNTPVTLFVDRSAPNGGNGALTSPFNSIPAALAATLPGDIVRIVGNGGADGNINTVGDNLAYQLGFDQISGGTLRDGASLVVPKNVTVMVDAGAVFQMRRSLIRVGSTQTTASTDRSGGALQVLGVPGRQVYFTSFNDTTIGKDENPLNTPVAKGDWGGILFRNDQDRIAGRYEWEEQGAFLNYVNYADIRYGGGQVNVDGGQLSVVTPIHIVDARPTVTNNLITRSAEAAMSATPNSFRETTFDEPRYQIEGNYQKSFNVDYGRVGPEIHGNTLISVENGVTYQNTLNGLFVRTRTSAGSTLQELTVAGRFDDTDITHILSENLVIRGTPSGPTLENGTPVATDPTITTGKPPITNVIMSQQAGNGALPAGFYRYRLVYVDQYGNEGRVSDLLTITVNSNGSSVTLAQLPLAPAGSEFVGRRIYRAGADNVFNFVDQIASVETTFVDKGAPPKFIRFLDSTQFAASLWRPRLDASLRIDPNVVVKLDAARIEVGMGASLIAEGNDGQEVIFTSLSDDRFGASGTFDTRGDASANPAQVGQWGGIYASPNSRISLDYVNILYGGGLTRTNGNFGGFNPVEIHQADARIAHSLFQFNLDGQGGTTNGRAGMATNATASIFVRGAQPILVDNIIRDNRGAAININLNALNSIQVVDSGRQTGLVDRMNGFFDNNGPLVRGNLLSNNGIPGQDGYNGMIVRGAVLTTEGVWDDTDIAHILLDEVSITDMHTFGGLRLESAAKESLVVKSQGANARFYVNGRPLETDDRIGGMLHILGQQGFPVIMTSLSDDTVGAGLTPDLTPVNDTNNDGTGEASGGLPTGPEVNNGTLIDNDVSPIATPGFFEVRPGIGGSITGSGVTAQGNTQLFVDQDFIFDHLNYIDIEGNGQGRSLDDPSFSTITQPPTLISPDRIRTQGTFTAPNGPVNWTVDTYLLNGESKVYNQVTFDSARPLGNIRFINYLDEDVGSPSNDLLYLVGSPGQADFRAFTLDNAERIGFSQGGFYAPGPELVNATFEGFAADQYNDLQSTIQNAGTTYSLTGNINTASLPVFSDPALGNVYGLNDVTTAFAWSVNPASTTATITSFLELVAADPATKGQPGDWQGIVIDKYSHDRNVDTVLEQEDSSSAATNSNGTPLTSQLIGLLAPNEKSGDETRRLGFTVHGDINARNDVDVYSFKADAGTQVWIDLDRTTSSLDAIVEVVDSDGFVLARSNDSYHENRGTQGLFGLGKVMQNAPPFEGRDFYTTNVRDPGMRMVLPGPAGANSEYFIRVRSNSGNLNTLVGGQTQGAYQLQLRLQEKDEFGGTVVRYADIRNAVNGIQVLGQPIHSPLAGEHSDVDENGGNNDSPGSAQNLGNAVNVDRGATSIAGMLGSQNDVDWYTFTLDIDKVQGFGEVADPSDLLYSMMFDLDYADGLGRANAVLSVFNEQGQLILSSRDSNIADDQPNTINPGATDDLSRGSLGTADPFIGPAYLPAGLNSPAFGNNATSRTYFVAVSSDARLPNQWNQFFSRTPANTLARFQPVNSAKRIVEDHINEGNGQSAPRGTGQLADVQVMIDNNSFVPFNLGDVSLFINRNVNSIGQTNASELLTADPFTGASETWVGTQGGQQIYDIAFRNDEELFAYSQGTAFSPITDANSDDFIQIDTGNGAATKVSDTGIRTYALYPNGTNPPQLDIAHDLGGPNRVGWGIQMEALMFANLEGDAADELLAVGNRGDGGFGTFPGENLLFQMNPNTGAPLVNGTPVGVVPGNPPSYFGSLTSALELGVIDTTVDGGPGGLVTGMATIGGTMYAISDAGGLYTVSTNLAGQRGMSRNSPGIVNLVTTNYIASSEPELEGIEFQALTAGPQDVEGGRYANLLFAVDTDGRMYAFNTAGELQPIFEGGATSIQLRIHSRDSVAPVALTNVRGIAFGRLDENLWHTTPYRNNVQDINNQRQDDVGHGLDVTFDGSVKPRTADADEMEEFRGNSSLYFGDPNALVQNRKVRGSGGTNTYDAPGGAYGTVVSNEFSLKGYSEADQPVLYYNYYLNSEEAYDGAFEDAGRQIRDSVKVYVSDNNGDWELLSGDYEERFTDPANDGLNSMGSRMWETSNWRQVRINLGDHAGKENLRLRFDFSTASDMNLGDTNTTGEEIRAVAGKYIDDGDQFSIDGQRYEFESGVTIVTSPGSTIMDGDTFSVLRNGVQTTWEFDRSGNGVTSPNIAIAITGFETATEIATLIRNALAIQYGVTPRLLNDNRVNLDFLINPLTDGAVVNAAVGGLVTEGNVGVGFGALPVPFHRGMTRVEVAQQIDAVLEPVFTRETLVVRGTGANFNDGDTFVLQIDGVDLQTFEFQTPAGLPGVTPGNVLVNVDPSWTAAQVSSSIRNAVAGYLGASGRTATYNAADQARVRLNGVGTERFGLRNPNNLLLELDVTTDLVKTHRDLVRVIGHTVDFAGPLGWDNQLDGDALANATDRGFFSNTRGQNNSFEGVYIDDIVIGLAERGEMITGATADTGFQAVNPALQPDQNLEGTYQLEMRRGPDYALPGRLGALFPVIGGVPQSIDSNDRLGSSTSVTLPAGADIIDGKTMILSDGVNEVRFEFDADGIVAPGNVAVTYTSNSTAAELAVKLRDAINSPAAQAVLTVSAQLADGARPGQFSTNNTVNIVGDATFQSYGLSPTEQNDFRSNATPLNLNEQSSYVIDASIGDNPNRPAGQDVDLYKIYLFANESVYLDVDAQSIGSNFQSYLRVFDSATPVAANNFGTAPGEAFTLVDSYLKFTAPTEGFYYVGVSGKGNENYAAQNGSGSTNGSTGRYRLEISRSLPRTTDLVKVNNRPYGDENLHRDQGQLILEGNRISNSENWGIVVDEGQRDSGTAPHQSPTRNLREPNQTVPGVVIVNNIIFNNDQGGIRFSGSADVNGSELGAIPYGRIVNNTIFGKGGSLLQQPVGTDIGIRVENRASPTLMNNIVANFATGISVDGTSQNLGTVIGGTVYQGNIQNTNVPFTNSIEFNSITLTNAERLFVDPSVGNFYLLPGSAAIDSSIDSLLDRANMFTVRNPLGIPPSPILAPERDASGQLRIDDPNAVSPGGSGENVYKDRGALDRSDFVGPTSFLLTPLDNGPDDGDATVSKVVLGNASLSSFEIQLSDLGLGMDDNSIISQAILVEDSQGSGYRTLIPGTDYTFSYNPTNSTVILRPTSGVWTVGRDYRITIDQSITDGTPNVAIRDAAGNLLQPNRNDGTVVYEIFLGTAVDWGDAAATFPVLSANNGASHQIRGNLMLGTNISAETNGQPSSLANADNFDDGLVNFNISPGIQSSITVLAQGTGVLDAWLDRNKNGIWEANEKLTFTNGNTVGGGVARQLLFQYGNKNDVKGDTALRLRYSSAGISTAFGAAADGEVEDYIVTMVGPKWQNANNRFDVDNNGFVQSRDALLIVNLLSNYDTDSNGIVNPNTDLPPSKQAPPPYYDVNGDGLVSSLDALAIVNRLNNPSASTLASTDYASSSVVYQPKAPTTPTLTTQTVAVDAVFAAAMPSDTGSVITAKAAATTSPQLTAAPAAPKAPTNPAPTTTSVVATTPTSTDSSRTVSRSKAKQLVSSNNSSDNSAALAAMFTTPTNSTSSSTSAKKKDGDASSFDDFFSRY